MTDSTAGPVREGPCCQVTIKAGLLRLRPFNQWLHRPSHGAPAMALWLQTLTLHPLPKKRLIKNKQSLPFPSPPPPLASAFRKTTRSSQGFRDLFPPKPWELIIHCSHLLATDVRGPNSCLPEASNDELTRALSLESKP